MFKQIDLPIVNFSVEDFKINAADFVERTKNKFYTLPWDEYDAKRDRIEFLRNKKSGLGKQLSADYYLGRVNESALVPYFEKLTADEKLQYRLITPYRRRSISEFNILSHGSDMWHIDRIVPESFSQTEAKTSEDDVFDYRQLPRTFADTDEAITEDYMFKKIITGVASMIKSNLQSIKGINLVAHHVMVNCTDQFAGDNSPEGIHQDGYDYIVSALVVERYNIDGGMSQIFGRDKKTRIYKTMLRPGFGLLQPDRGSELWHNVTKFSVADKNTHGYRSTLGFDINIIH